MHVSVWPLVAVARLPCRRDFGSFVFFIHSYIRTKAKDTRLLKVMAAVVALDEEEARPLEAADN